MRICLISHEYTPFPGGGIATYNQAAATHLAEAGHEVHVVTNNEVYSSTRFEDSVEYWRERNLHIHRLSLFDKNKTPSEDIRFFEIGLLNYPDPFASWAYDPSNLAASRVAGFVEGLHRTLGMDIIEVPEYFAEAFYAIRQRQAGGQKRFPPICVIGHTSSRQLLHSSRHINFLGQERQRHMMAREEYCIRAADGLLTPSHSLMGIYEEHFGAEHLPKKRAVLPYYVTLEKETGEVPASINTDKPYLVCVSRIEPRKGSDVALKAFSQIADLFPDLQLVYLGREAWRAGENFDDVIDANLPKQHRDRVLRVGNVSRKDVLATVQAATVFVHAAPWDNYPSAVLEALHLGVACVVTDCGGHAEMIVDGESGLVFPAGDATALASAVTTLLQDKALTSRLQANGKAHIQEITSSEVITEKKIAFFESIIEDETVWPFDVEEVRVPGLAQPAASNTFKVEWGGDSLPSSGSILIDAAASTKEHIETTIRSIRESIVGHADWKVYVIHDDLFEGSLPDGWKRYRPLDPVPWSEQTSGDLLILVRAGVAFDHQRFGRMIQLLVESPFSAGVFPWLRTPTIEWFPYASDSRYQDLLLRGTMVLSCLCVRREDALELNDMVGLDTFESRMATLIALVGATTDKPFLHTGDLDGHVHFHPAWIDDYTQERALGWLESLGKLDPYLYSLHGSERIMLYGTKGPLNSLMMQDPHLVQEVHSLREVRDQFRCFLESMPVRVLRNCRVFDVLRKVCPKTRSYLGNGDQKLGHADTEVP